MIKTLYTDYQKSLSDKTIVWLLFFKGFNSYIKLFSKLSIWDTWFDCWFIVKFWFVTLFILLFFDVAFVSYDIV